MSRIDAAGVYFKDLNAQVRQQREKEITIENCNGQRYVGGGLADARLEIWGTPGNGLGAYLNGAQLTVRGNAQDAAGDTMNDGLILIHGSAGDGTGYAMRGGAVYIRDDVGYRAGIHMKAYQDKLPVLVVGGKAGSFLGEYQAGGVIVVLGIGCGGALPAGNFCGTGMHGGTIYLRSDEEPGYLSGQIEASAVDATEIKPYIDAYCGYFDADKRELMAGTYYRLTPNTKNPYKQLYTHM